MKSRRSAVSAPPVVPPPPSGSLPIGDGSVAADEAPYRVIFVDNTDNYMGIEGVLLNDLQTVLVSADAAEIIGGNLSKYFAVMGVSDLSDFSLSETQGCSFTQTDPSWAGAGDFPNNIGLVYCTLPFTVSAERQPIEYSAAVGTTPYDGEYFYPASTIVAWSSNLEQDGSPSVITIEEGTKGSVLSDGGLSVLGYGTDDTNIGIEFGTSSNQGATGAGLICAGYSTNYFCIGVFLFTNDSDKVAVFTRVSDSSNWIEFATGVNPIIYP
jgi:hypothetical protein